MAISMGDNIANTMNTDAEGRKLENLPMMNGINNYTEMNLVTEFSGSVAGAIWYTYIRPKFGVNVAVGITAVMAADLYPFLQSGQLIGMLSGLKGAAEYEKLVDVFAAYREADVDYRQKTDEYGNKIIPGRPFSREILADESTTKLINITKQTIAEFSPEEYQIFVTRYPGKEAVFESIKSEEGGKVLLDVSDRQRLQNELGVYAFDDLDRLTRDIKYKFKVARIGMNAQSVAHIMIILFIILGNIGYFMQKLRTGKN